MSKNKCIYCNSTENLCKSAHIVPRGMGRFENQPTLKNRVCCDCDYEIGRYEEQFMKCGPEGFLRSVLGIRGKSKKDPRLPFHRKYAGHGPISAKCKYPGTNYEILLEPISGSNNWRPLRQLVVVDVEGNCTQIPLPDIKSLKEKLSNIKDNFNGKFRILPFGLTEQESEQLISNFKDLNLFVSEDADERLQPCNTMTDMSASSTFDKRYFQAIAKIAFHYFLQYTSYVEVLEPYLAPILQFIRYGKGEFESFLTKREGYLIPELKNWRPHNYGHVLISDFKNKNVEVHLQFFIGPDYAPPCYHVTIAKAPLSIFIPHESFGHCYVYYDPDKRTKFDGRMDKVGIATRIIMPRRFSPDYL